jgi:hypothetical protein
MHKIRPVIVIGIGPQAEQSIQSYMDNVHIRQGAVPAVLPVVLGFSPASAPFRQQVKGFQQLTLSSPLFVEEDEWPTWFPAEFTELPLAEKKRTRAWLRAAMLQHADDLQEFLLESIPQLSSFASVEELGDAGLALSGDSEIRVYVVADLSDQLGSSVFVDVAYLTYYVCRQLGLHPTTTGLLFLPSATSPAPAEEAMAYAALKELEHYFQTRKYNGPFAPDWAVREELAPFQEGCYLIDNVNELGYTLESPDQQVTAVGEWLYAMSLLDLQGSIREHHHRKYINATLRGMSRAYESFGMALRYVPQVPLLDWTSAKLCTAAIDRLLNAPINGNPQRDVAAFNARVGLSVETLEGQLHQRVIDQPIDDTLAPLGKTPIGQVEAHARQVLQTIREHQLPTLDLNLHKASESIQTEVRHEIHNEVRAILQDRTMGGIPSAQRFLELIQEQVEGLQKEVDDMSSHHRVELKQSLATISRAHYTLRSVMMSIPPWPLLVLSVGALLVLPLTYILQLVTRVVYSLNTGLGNTAIAVLVLGLLAVVGFIAQRLVRQRRLVADQHKNMIRQRFELESRPLFSKAIKAIYVAAQEATEEAAAALEPLVAQLDTVQSHFNLQTRQSALQLRELARPSPFRSFVGEAQAERFFAQVSNKVDPFIEHAVEETGSVAEWHDRALENAPEFSAWLSDELEKTSAQYLQPYMQEISVMQVMPNGTSPQHLQQQLERMFESARPLWNYDPRVLRRAKTEQMTFIGADTDGSGWAEMVGPISKVDPDILPLDTRDPFTMVVMRIHRGMPLFALRRLKEYRAHYAEMLWHSRLPLHTTADMTLLEDLVPIRRSIKLPTPSIFGAGLALGSISRDASGRYIAPRPRGQSFRLGTQKERSVALLSMDAASCRELGRQLAQIIKTKGRHAVRTILDEYVTVMPDLADWEVQGILAFGNALRLGE